MGLAALGHQTVRLLLLPQLQPYMERLQPLLEPPQVDGPQVDVTGAWGVAGGSKSGGCLCRCWGRRSTRQVHGVQQVEASQGAAAAAAGAPASART